MSSLIKSRRGRRPARNGTKKTETYQSLRIFKVPPGPPCVQRGCPRVKRESQKFMSDFLLRSSAAPQQQREAEFNSQNKRRIIACFANKRLRFKILVTHEQLDAFGWSRFVVERNLLAHFLHTDTRFKLFRESRNEFRNPHRVWT